MMAVCSLLKELCRRVPTEELILGQYSRVCIAFSEMIQKVPFALFIVVGVSDSRVIFTFHQDGVLDQLDVEYILSMVDMKPEDCRAKIVKDSQKTARGVPVAHPEFVLLDFSATPRSV